jgi:hypothetical protein
MHPRAARDSIIIVLKNYNIWIQTSDQVPAGVRVSQPPGPLHHGGLCAWALPVIYKNQSHYHTQFNCVLPCYVLCTVTISNIIKWALK